MFRFFGAFWLEVKLVNFIFGKTDIHFRGIKGERARERLYHVHCMNDRIEFKLNVFELNHCFYWVMQVTCLLYGWQAAHRCNVSWMWPQIHKLNGGLTVSFVDSCLFRSNAFDLSIIVGYYNLSSFVSIETVWIFLICSSTSPRVLRTTFIAVVIDGLESYGQWMCDLCNLPWMGKLHSNWNLNRRKRAWTITTYEMR